MAQQPPSNGKDRRTLFPPIDPSKPFLPQTYLGKTFLAKTYLAKTYAWKWPNGFEDDDPGQ